MLLFLLETGRCLVLVPLRGADSERRRDNSKPSLSLAPARGLGALTGGYSSATPPPALHHTTSHLTVASQSVSRWVALVGCPHLLLPAAPSRWGGERRPQPPHLVKERLQPARLRLHLDARVLALDHPGREPALPLSLSLAADGRVATKRNKPRRDDMRKR